MTSTVTMTQPDAADSVQHEWDALYDDLARSTSPLHCWLCPLVVVMRRLPPLAQLFPYTSHDLLCLSRATQYPYTVDCPHAVAVAEGRFRVFSPRHTLVAKSWKGHEWNGAVFDVLGEGDAGYVADLIALHLPPGCGPAIAGTAFGVYGRDVAEVQKEFQWREP